MISVETLTLPPADNGVTITMVRFKDEHDRQLGHVLFNEFSDRPMAIVSFHPGEDVTEAHGDENCGYEQGNFIVFLTPDDSKLLPKRPDLPVDLPENVSRLFPNPNDEA